MADDGPGSSASATATASSVAVRRLRRELDGLRTSRNPQLAVRPSEDNMLEWHFVLHSFPSDTPYQGGFYHGRLVFPPTYPHAPPAILMSTPSGRLETGKRLCLSMSDWHPENWNPAWSVETILVGLLSFFVSDSERGYGSISATPERRRALAASSTVTNARDRAFRELFPEFLGGGDGGEASAVESEPNNTVIGGSGAGAGAGPQPFQQAAAATEEPAEAAATGRDGGGARGAASAAASEEEGTGAGGGVGSVGGDGSAEGGGSARGAAPAAAADAEQAVPAPAQAEEEEEEANECWICREDSSSEPLIHPCGCRGSMSGVHASCVEQWIQAHRRTALNDDPPRCGVCQQPYRGNEQRPGLQELLRQQCRNFFQLLPAILGIVGRVLLFFFYLDATLRPQGIGFLMDGAPPLLRIAIVVAFLVLLAYKTALLTVSLPPHRVPPRNRFARPFFVSDSRAIFWHVYEVVWFIAVGAGEYLQGSMPLVFFLPLLIVFLVPLIKILVTGRQRVLCAPMQCLRGLGLLLLAPFVLPAVLVRVCCTVLWFYRLQWMHPLAAGPPILIAVAALVLCLLCDSNIPVVSLLGSHALLALAGLLELLLLKRLRWQQGPLWWFAFELAWLLAWFVQTDAVVFPKGFGAPGQRDLLVRLVSCAWACLVSGLAAGVNYELLRGHVMQAYRTWQHRNASFQLQVPGRGGDGRGGQLGEPLAAGAAAGAEAGEAQAEAEAEARRQPGAQV